MVLTRFSHIGEECPLNDHSYRGFAAASSSQTAAKRINGVSAKPAICEDENVGIPLLSMPTEIVDKIFSFLPYKNVGSLRVVCKRFDVIASNILSCTFQKLQQQMLQRFQTIKSQMPRRESARRKHPLARESDIIETLHMRLTLLQMTFGKHIKQKHCCFFPGEILDEVYKILYYVKSTHNLSKAYKVTDELFDLSTMAMEYFKEHIEGGLPEITYFGTPDFLDLTRFSADSSRSSTLRASDYEDEIQERDPLPPSNMVLRKRIRSIRKGMKKYSTQLADLKRELKGCKGKIADQQRTILEYASRMEDYDRRAEETSRKLSSVLQELNKCKTEFQFWKSKSAVHFVQCQNCGHTLAEQEEFDNQSVDGKIQEVCIPEKSGSIAPCDFALEKTLSESHNIEILEKFKDESMCNSKIEVKDLELVKKPGLGPKRRASDEGDSGLERIENEEEFNNIDSVKRKLKDFVNEDNTVGKRVKERKRSKIELTA